MPAEDAAPEEPMVQITTEDWIRLTRVARLGDGLTEALAAFLILRLESRGRESDMPAIVKAIQLGEHALAAWRETVPEQGKDKCPRCGRLVPADIGELVACADCVRAGRHLDEAGTSGAASAGRRGTGG